MDCFESAAGPGMSANVYELLFRTAMAVPAWDYFVGMVIVFMVFLYKFLEFHFLADIFSGFRGSPVLLVYNSCSRIYQEVASKCETLSGRYLATPWLSSPHFQTVFINFLGRPPIFNYKRQLFHASDGGTFALDWLMHSDVSQEHTCQKFTISKDDEVPILIVIPGLSSDSAAPYLKHLVFATAKRGWDVVVCNHRGLGGISVTSDRFYHAGWTGDIREVVNHLHQKYPNRPFFIVGTSLGANMLVKYLGEDGNNTPVAGAATICCPWDLLISSRFISRRLIQKVYNRAIAFSLREYAHLHKLHFSRLADFGGIKKSRFIRDFDTYATCLVEKYETVDTYYRRSSSSPFVGCVSVPLLCIGALDDPLCTTEAIPWDECRKFSLSTCDIFEYFFVLVYYCSRFFLFVLLLFYYRLNENIILAMTKHGGHLAFFEGLSASSLWWVKAVNEFFGTLHASPCLLRKRHQTPSLDHAVIESSIAQSLYVTVATDGIVTELGTDELRENEEIKEYSSENAMDEEQSSEKLAAIVDTCKEKSDVLESATTRTIERCCSQVSVYNRRSMWLLAYIAILSSWPLLGTALNFLLKKKIKNVSSFFHAKISK